MPGSGPLPSQFFFLNEKSKTSKCASCTIGLDRCLLLAVHSMTGASELLKRHPCLGRLSPKPAFVPTQVRHSCRTSFHGPSFSVLRAPLPSQWEPSAHDCSPVERVPTNFFFFQKLTLMDSPGAWGLGAPGAESPGPPSTSTPLWPVRNTCINLGTTESRVPCTRFHLLGLLGLFFMGRIFSTRVAEYDHTCLLPVFFTCRFYVGARRAQIKSRVNFRSFRLTCLLLVTTSSLSCFPTNTCFINRRSQICRHGKLYVLLEF